MKRLPPDGGSRFMDRPAQAGNFFPKNLKWFIGWS